MLATLILRAGLPALDACIEIGKMRARLEASMDARLADRLLRTAAARALQTTRPLDALRDEVKFIVTRATDQASKALLLEPREAENNRKRKRHRHHVRSHRMKP